MDITSHSDAFEAFVVPGILKVSLSIMLNQLTGTFMGQIGRRRNTELLKFWQQPRKTLNLFKQAT